MITVMALRPTARHRLEPATPGSADFGRTWGDTTSEATPLTLEECRQLLASRSEGQLGLSQGALPVIVPASYTVMSDHVWLWPGPGVEARAPWQQQVVAFQVGQTPTAADAGWTVLLQGVAQEVDDLAPEQPMARCFRVSVDLLSGWSLAAFGSHLVTRAAPRPHTSDSQSPTGP